MEQNNNKKIYTVDKIWNFICQHKYILGIFCILIFSALLRYSGYNWDDLHEFHPDERAIGFASNKIEFLKLKLDPEFFAYGTLPIYITKILNNILSIFDPGWSDFSYLIITGRLVSATAGILTVLLVYLIALKLYNKPIAIVSSLFLALTVSHIQDSHFATVDVILSFFIVLSIYFLIDIFDGKGTYKSYLLAAGSIGLALAAKVSALPLLFVFLVCHIVNLIKNRKLFDIKEWLKFTGYGLFIIAVNFIAQPYAYIHFSEFIGRIQSELYIAKTGDICYDQQYIGTPFLLYNLRELIFRSMGPPLGLLAIGSFILAIVTSIYKFKSSRHIVLLLWSIPYFVIINTYTVKYIRYMEPLFPFFCLFAGYYLVILIQKLWTTKTKKALSIVITSIIIGYTFFYALAFFSIYMKPHTTVTGSKWFYQNIPEDSYVLSQHWDEGFPLPLRKTENKDYNIVQLELYEHFGCATEDRIKAEYLAHHLKKGDYVVAQTRRLYGAVANVKDRYPITTKYFDLLFTNQLGYELVKEFHSYPKLLGIEINDDLSDESFSVYDHPKILIFKKTREYSEEEYITLLENTSEYSLTKEDMLQIHQKDYVEHNKYTIVDEILFVCCWIILFELLCFMGIVIGQYIFKRTNGSLFFYTHLIGLLFFCYTIWLLSSIKLMPYTQIFVISIFLVALLLSSITVYKNRKPIKDSLLENRDTIFYSHLWFICIFIIFLLIRSLSPEIYWGEKPMDFGIFNNLIKTNSLPPDEIWFAGNKLQYYYFGHFIFATLAKLTSIPAYIVYNLALATIAGLSFNAAAGILNLFRQNYLASALAGIFTVFWGNLSGIREYLYNDNPINFHFFWATSRVIPHTVNEFPLWGITFGDLHAHILVIPIFLFLIYTSTYIFKGITEDTSLHWSIYITAGFLLGCIYVTNSWDFPGSGLIMFMCISMGILTQILAMPKTEGVRKYSQLLVLLKHYILLTLSVLASIIWFLPYWVTNKSTTVLNFGIINSNEYIRFNDYLIIWGFFLFIFATFFLYQIYTYLKKRMTNDHISSKLGIIIIILFTGLAILFASSQENITTLIFTSILLALSLISFITTKDKTLRLFNGLITLGIGITLFTQIFFIIDHMNTIFKFFLEVWYLFAISGAYILTYLTKSIRNAFTKHPNTLIVVGIALWVVTLITLSLLSLFTVYTVILGFSKTGHIPEHKPVNTINGIEYMKYMKPKEYMAINWINNNIEYPATVLEAQTKENNAYSGFGRIVMNTGLPTLIGWEHHLSQRAISRNAINKRYEATSTIYTTENAETAYRLLKKYGIDYVYYGDLESIEYGLEGLSKFQNNTKQFKTVYSNSGVKIFKVL
jgi:YYY domain-containing protein